MPDVKNYAVSITDASKIKGCSRQTIHEWIRRGKIKLKDSKIMVNDHFRGLKVQRKGLKEDERWEHLDRLSMDLSKAFKEIEKLRKRIDILEASSKLIKGGKRA